MSNESVEITHHLVDSHEEHFSQPNPDLLAAMRAHPLFAGIGFDELKMAREGTGDGKELMKTAGQVLIGYTSKTAEEHSSLVGLVMPDSSTGESVFEQNLFAPPSSRLDEFKKRRLENFKNEYSSCA